MFIAATDVDLDLGGLVLGLILGGLLALLVKIAMERAGAARYAVPVAVLLFVAIVVVLGFDIRSTEVD